MYRSSVKVFKRCVGVMVVWLFCSAAYSASLSVGELAPNFTGTTLDGREVSLKDFRGRKPVYIKFWATWCHYCVVELPHLQEIHNLKKDAFEVLLVNVGMNDSVENIQSLFEKKGFDMPVIVDKNGSIVSAYHVVGTPHQLLIGTDGRIQYQTFIMNDELDQLLRKL